MTEDNARVLQVGVKIFLQNEKGEYLLLKKSPNHYPGIDFVWDIPGGRINAGSPLMENLKREVMEETGIELNCTPRLITAQDIIRNDKHVVRLTYVGTTNAQPKLDGKEHTGFEWFSRSALSNLKGLDSYIAEVVNAGLI